jgi:PLP dependent protein
MLQVRTSEEESKSGVLPGEELNELVKCINNECTRLQLQGLMTIGKEGDLDAFKVG